MGVLDDAIRQHIELKRQHGASEEELRLEEHEALGPARRERAAPGEREAPDEPQEAEGETSDTAVLPAVEAADLAAPEEFHEAPGAAGPPPFVEDDPFSDDEPFAEREAPAAVVSGEELEDEDVLEETPEFLQDTPEHDRLWFEQKPPRDFDFDED